MGTLGHVKDIVPDGFDVYVSDFKSGVGLIIHARQHQH